LAVAQVIDDALVRIDIRDALAHVGIVVHRDIDHLARPAARRGVDEVAVQRPIDGAEAAPAAADAGQRAQPQRRDDGIDALDGRAQRRRVGRVGDHGLHALALQALEALRIASDGAHAIAARDEDPHDLTAQRPARAGNEDGSTHALLLYSALFDA